MRIQKVTEMEEVKKLWKDCFGDTDAYMQFYFTWKTKDNEILGIYQEDQLVSMLHLNPYQVSIHGNVYQSYYVVGVATETSYRKQGLMRKVLEHSIQAMNEERVPFTYLMPASEAIYLPFDFRIITHQRRMSYPMEDLRRQEREVLYAASIEEKRYSIVSVTETSNELSNIQTFANQYLKNTEDVYTIRDVYYYERMMAELKACNGGMLAIKVDGDIEGYISYVIEQEKVEVLECLSTGETEEWLIDAMKEEVLARTEEEQFVRQEPSQAPPMMARIIHLTTFLESLRSKQPVNLVIEVSDPIIEENNGRFMIDCKPDSCSVTKLLDQEYDREIPEIISGIASLIQLFFGTLSETSQMELFEGDIQAVANKIQQMELYENVYLNEIV